MQWLYLFFALMAGVGVSTQLGVNSQLRNTVINPILSALISFSVGTIVLAIYMVANSRNSIPSFDVLRNIVWWKWMGGVLGALYVTAAIMIAPRIGAANFVSLVIAGQLLATLWFDHFGYLGFTIHPVNIYRLLGAMLIVLGVYLIQKY
ncbi:DMT family transporter [Xanthocytophaga agilis]|uniref:DMT family transporter n=1 Tax=Xanthocytophaga agilis TaxID=3048010 RepID=A0AAE3R497_9BACT|nr:DMT family transporter [Xanthocytophaga agilis]MDJ1500588.1 DMT family transporter [Xanthocytophaga agilis]